MRITMALRLSRPTRWRYSRSMVKAGSDGCRWVRIVSCLSFDALPVVLHGSSWAAEPGRAGPLETLNLASPGRSARSQPRNSRRDAGRGWPVGEVAADAFPAVLGARAWRFLGLCSNQAANCTLAYSHKD